MDELGSYIKALTQSERRFFERYARLQTDNETRYLQLYRAIQKQKVYQEEKLKQVVGAYLFPQLKQQLLKKINEAMVIMHFNHGKAKVPYQLICSVMLRNKEQDVLANKTLNKTLELAIENLHYTAELDAHTLAHSKLMEGAAVAILKEKARTYAIRSEIVLKQLKEQTTFELLLLEISILKEELESVRDVQQQKRIDDFLKKPMLQDNKKYASLFGQASCAYGKAMCYYLTGNFSKAEYFFDHLYELTRLVPEEAVLLNDLYKKALANRTLVAIQLKKFELAEEYLTTLELYYQSHNERARLLSLKLNYLNKCKKFEQAYQCIESFEVSKLIRELKDLNQEKIYLFFGMVSTLFGLGQFKEASFIVRDFIKTDRKGNKHDAYFMARIIYLAIQFELGNEGLVDSELKSVQRMLKLQKRKYQFETVFLRFVNQMQMVQSEKDKHNEFKRLYHDLQKLQYIPFERNAFVYFDFLSWAHSKYN